MDQQTEKIHEHVENFMGRNIIIKLTAREQSIHYGQKLGSTHAKHKREKEVLHKCTLICHILIFLQKHQKGMQKEVEKSVFASHVMVT